MYQAALGSALSYLVEGGIACEIGDGQQWCLAEDWHYLEWGPVIRTQTEKDGLPQSVEGSANGSVR